jgi:AcrR family transcriptional regulator
MVTFIESVHYFVRVAVAKQTDLRVIRTRQMIRDAFLELMDTVGFSKITVENLAKKAFISRNTFYLHYTDKFDLLNQLENEILAGLREIISDLPFDDMKANGLTDRATMVLRHVFAYVQENHIFFKLVMSENGDPAFLPKLGETIKTIMLDKGMESKLRIPGHYMAAIIVGVQTGVIGEWLRGGMAETPEEVANILATVLRDVPKSLLAD